MGSYDTDSVDKPPKSYRVSLIDISVLLYAIIFHFVDIGFDIFLAYSYFVTEQYSYFAWTAAFTVVPTVVIAAISIRMYAEDCEGNLISCKGLLRPGLCIAGLIVQLAPVIRYIDSLRYARLCLKAESESDKKLQEMYYKRMLKEDSDAALLKVFECYLESTFQQVLQVTLLLIDYSRGSQLNMIKQCIMITLSFISMGWCVATYHKCIRFDKEDKENISKLGTIAQFLWHLNLTVSRIFAISAVSILFPFWAIIAVACHWCSMTVWISVSAKTNFCGRSHILEILFSGAVGLIYIFDFLSLKDGPTRKSYYIFFSICGVENLIASILWGINSHSLIQNWTYYVFLTLPIATFLLSVIFAITYYGLLHPTNPTFLIKKRKKVFYGDQLPNICPEQEIRFED